MNDQNKIQIDDLPFFARFLENQMAELPETEAEDVVGGMTIKKPIDRVSEIGHLPAFGTNKYPSDGDDNTPIDRPFHPVQTAKHPSDGEDSHSRPIMPMTKKYPSDFEDTTHH
jgi:hypothetical protein